MRVWFVEVDGVCVLELLFLFVFLFYVRALRVRTDGLYTYLLFQSALIRLLLLFSFGFDNANFQFFTSTYSITL